MTYPPEFREQLAFAPGHIKDVALEFGVSRSLVRLCRIEHGRPTRGPKPQKLVPDAPPERAPAGRSGPRPSPRPGGGCILTTAEWLAELRTKAQP